MSSIVLDLQQELISGNCDVMSALRKAHLIASNLHLTEFDAWVQSELNGYDSYESIPEYRVASGILKANDHFRGWTTVVIQDAKTEKAICERRLGDSIGDIIELSKHVTGSFVINIPGDLAKYLDKRCESMYPTNYAVFISDHKLKSIVESVINCLLEWTIKLSAEGIFGEGMQFNREEKEKASAVPQTINNFYAPANIVNAPANHSAIVAGNENNVKFSYEAANDAVTEIETSIRAEDISPEDRDCALEMLTDIRNKIDQKKKPGIIKSLLVGLKDFLIGVGASATVAVIQSVLM